MLYTSIVTYCRDTYLGASAGIAAEAAFALSLQTVRLAQIWHCCLSVVSGVVSSVVWFAL
jgi:hypothetical protein